MAEYTILNCSYVCVCNTNKIDTRLLPMTCIIYAYGMVTTICYKAILFRAASSLFLIFNRNDVNLIRSIKWNCLPLVLVVFWLCYQTFSQQLKLCMKSSIASIRKYMHRIKFKQTPFECDGPIFYHMHTVIIVTWFWSFGCEIICQNCEKKLSIQNNFTHWDVFYAQSLSGTITLMLQHSIPPSV